MGSKCCKKDDLASDHMVILYQLELKKSISFNQTSTKEVSSQNIIMQNQSEDRDKTVEQSIFQEDSPNLVKEMKQTTLINKTNLMSTNTPQPPQPILGQSKYLDGSRQKIWVKVKQGKYIFGEDHELRGNFTFEVSGFEGEGLYISPQLTFKGMFKNSKPYSGILIFVEGTRVDLKSPLFGKVIWKNGRKYSGDLLNKKPHGVGKMKMENGDIYLGGFANGLFQGSGTYTWKNGCNYKGQYSGGLKHGKGVFTDPEGFEIEGVWEHGQIVSNNSDSLSKISKYDQGTPKQGGRTPKTARNLLPNVKQEFEQNSPTKVGFC